MADDTELMDLIVISLDKYESVLRHMLKEAAKSDELKHRMYFVPEWHVRQFLRKNSPIALRPQLVT